MASINDNETNGLLEANERTKLTSATIVHQVPSLIKRNYQHGASIDCIDFDDIERQQLFSHSLVDIDNEQVDQVDCRGDDDEGGVEFCDILVLASSSDKPTQLLTSTTENIDLHIERLV